MFGLNRFIKAKCAVKRFYGIKIKIIMEFGKRKADKKNVFFLSYANNQAHLSNNAIMCLRNSENFPGFKLSHYISFLCYG